MSFKSFIAVPALLAVGAIGAVLQQPLGLDHLHICGQSIAGQDLCAKLTNRPFQPDPIGLPCYAGKGYDKKKCEKVNKNKRSDWFISNHPGGYFYGNWASCQAYNETCALPVNYTEGITKPIERKCFQGNVAPWMINLSNVSYVDDILAAFEYSRKTETPLVIKNTGHDWRGRSGAPDSLALWTHHLKRPHIPIEFHNQTFIPLNCSVTAAETVLEFGAGETWGSVYDFADKDCGVAVLGGTCGTVGVAGWLTGGGHSPFSTIKGLGVDNIRQVEIVTPDGKVQIANECHNEDLFFAIRGGGGGTFGVITKFWYKAFDRFEVQRFGANMTGIASNTLPEFLNITTTHALDWAKKGWGGYMRPGSYIEIVNGNTTENAAKSDMKPLIDFLKQNNKSYILKRYSSSWEWQKEVWGGPDKHPGASAATLASTLVPPSVFQGPQREEFTEKLAQIYSRTPQLMVVLMMITPTLYPHSKKTALHPSWEDAIWSVRVNEVWDQYSETTSEHIRERFQNVSDALKPVRNMEDVSDMGVSINEADIFEKNHHLTFWGEKNYERLLDIKRKVDPSNLLSTYHGVGWNKDAPRFKCYPKPLRS